MSVSNSSSVQAQDTSKPSRHSPSDYKLFFHNIVCFFSNSLYLFVCSLYINALQAGSIWLFMKQQSSLHWEKLQCPSRWYGLAITHSKSGTVLMLKLLHSTRHCSVIWDSSCFLSISKNGQYNKKCESSSSFSLHNLHRGETYSLLNFALFDCKT
jgi:hypothetical protein